MRYKSICNIVGQKSSIPEIDINNASTDELSEYFSLLIDEYNNLQRCYNGRVKYREKCIPKEKYDEGHNYQLNMLSDRMKSTSELINKIFDILHEEIISEETPIIEQDEYETIELIDNTIKTSQKQVQKKSSLEDEYLREQQKLRENVQKGNIKYIQQIAYDNPRLWKSIAFLAMEYNSIRILKEVKNQLNYLKDTSQLSSGDKKYILDSIEKYALKNDIITIIESIDSTNKLFDDKLLYYYKNGGLVVKKYVLSKILLEVLQLPKPINENALYEFNRLFEYPEDKKLQDLYSKIRHNLLNLQYIRDNILISTKIQQVEQIMFDIVEYIRLLLQTKSFASTNILQNELKILENIPKAINRLKTINPQLENLSKNFLDIFIKNYMPAIKVILLKQIRDSEKK